MKSPFQGWRERVDGFTATVDRAAVNFESSTRILVATVVIATAALVIAVMAFVR